MKYKEECREINPNLYCHLKFEKFVIKDKDTMQTKGEGLTALSAWRDCWKNGGIR